MPGIFLQVVVFGSLATAIGLATDLKSGLMERFHALPMWDGAGCRADASPTSCGTSSW
jgi:hypothetical protein